MMTTKRFRTTFGENIFRFKYAQGPDDTWDKLSERLVDDVCGTRGGTLPPLMSESDRTDLIEHIKQMRFLPGGRYLYYAGRPYKAYNNCLGAETNVLTDKGWRNIASLGTANVLSPVDGKFYPAEFKSHGKQQLNKITFATLRGHQQHTWSVRATSKHHWVLIDGTDTYDLHVGDVIPANKYAISNPNTLGFAHGFVYGDGNSNGQLRLCGDKKEYLNQLSTLGSVTYPASAEGDPVLYFNHDIKWKELPTNTDDPEYITAFITGWLAADGSETADNKLCCIDKEALLWFREYAAYAGIVITGKLRSQVRDVTLGKYKYNNHEIFIQNYQYGDKFSGFKVIKIEENNEEEVYCPYEPVHNRIIIDHNIDTYQCYLLRAEEDTREEWSAVTWRAMSCLMTGGGIGIDYSRLRGAGKALSRTGGTASGPIPLMYAINEIGRNVMQGGSRRSAIYASLNWQHADISEFLGSKNWTEAQRANKLLDFNSPAPLDMTNISVNYDDASLVGDLQNNAVFQRNCLQALSTGEPGFSFNFGSKQNETLRNAPVSGRTRVLTNQGYKNVQDVIGQEVVVWTGRQWATTVFKKTASEVSTVRVALSNGRSIDCSPEHPFIQWTKTKLLRTPAKELKPNTAIFTSLPVESLQEEDTAYGYGYGFVFGDGSIRNGKGEISYWHESKKECFEKAVGQLNAHTVSKTNRAYFNSDFLTKTFIPACSFIAGWFDADGSYSRDLLRLSSTDRDILVQASEYLDLKGIQTIVREDGNSSYKPEIKMYTLQVCKSSFKQFKELIPTVRINIEVPQRVRKQNTLVKFVESTGIYEDVYCCDVKFEEHSFMAEGVIISNCTEVTSEDDSDVCNLGSVNMGNIADLDEFKSVVSLASKFLVCGTLRADLPYEKVYRVREKNRRLGLGLMGIHEWLLKRGKGYEVDVDLRLWLDVYRSESESSANAHCERYYISKPLAYRAIAPTGSIGILAGTTTGIEPLFAVAYKRRFLTDGTKWRYQFVIDGTADTLIKEYGVKPDGIESALDLAENYEARIRFQADIQDYVDMSISSTINIPAWGSKGNNEGNVGRFTETLAKYAPRLRGFTAYPDGARGGQPLTSVPYAEALKHKDVIYEETDVCDLTGTGICGS
jgi:ribonucleotide reductase alpha subunit